MKKITNDTVGDTPKKVTRARNFNIIDALIILAVILLGAIVINIVVPSGLWGDLFKGSTKTIQYTVEFTGVDRDFVDNIVENDTVVDAVSKFALGTVTAIDNNSHYRVLGYNEERDEGGYTTYQDKYNVLITITVTANYEEGVGYTVGDRRIAVGEKLTLRFPNYVDEGYCIGVAELQGGAIDE